MTGKDYWIVFLALILLFVWAATTISFSSDISYWKDRCEKLEEK